MMLSLKFFNEVLELLHIQKVVYTEQKLIYEKNEGKSLLTQKRQ